MSVAEDEAWSQQYDQQQAAQQAKEQQAAQPKQPPTFLERAMAPVQHVTAPILDNIVAEAGRWGAAAHHVGLDINYGLTTAAVGAADTAKAFVTSSGEGLAAAEDPAHAQEALHPPSSPLWDHTRAAIMDFRDSQQVQDPTWMDVPTQKLAQFAAPFAWFSRGISALGNVGKLANWALSGIAADATVEPIDAPRENTADLLALGKHVQGKYLDALDAAGGAAAKNAFINFVASNDTHTDAEAKFKQTLDSILPNVAYTGLLLSGGSVLRQGYKGLRYAAENFGGSPPFGSPAAQRGAVGADLATTSEAPLKPEDKTVSKQSAEDIKPLDATVSETPPRTAALPSAPGELHTLDRAAEHTTALANVRSTLAEVHTTGEDKPAAKVFANLAKSIDQTASPENLHFKKVFEQLKAADTGNLTTATAGTHKTMGNVFGSYDPDAHTIAVHSAALQGDDSLLMHTLAHEGTHAATMRALDNPANAFLRRGVANLMQDAEKTNAVQALSAQDRYAFQEGKPAEFVAEAMSNPRLNAALKTEGLWPEVEDYIRRLLAPAAGAAVAAGITDADWKDPEFRKFFTDILTPREVPRA